MTDETIIRSIVEKVVTAIMQQGGYIKLFEKKVKVNASNRHMHLTQEHLDILFGKGSGLVRMKDLMQPGEFASEQTVTIVGPKGSIQNVRILGPVRKYTQVEVSLSDTFVLGVKGVELRDSGSLDGTSPITVVGPKGTVILEKGLILAQRHIHMTPEDAEKFGVKNGDWARARISGKREMVFEKVLVRVNPNYALEMHVDIDEANAAMVGSDTWAEVL